MLSLGLMAPCFSAVVHRPWRSLSLFFILPQLETPWPPFVSVPSGLILCLNCPLSLLLSRPFSHYFGHLINQCCRAAHYCKAACIIQARSRVPESNLSPRWTPGPGTRPPVGSRTGLFFYRSLMENEYPVQVLGKLAHRCP
jgi:hypothetical protein